MEITDTDSVTASAGALFNLTALSLTKGPEPGWKGMTVANDNT